ncbi:MAG: glycogen synthase GlgA [Gammaproteobacteria bacterium]|nr:glycogen synthase GlgA [Gammaproteobacteria bacterium]
MPKLLFVTSEAQPLIKTGGLADVSGSLPAALKKLRWSVRLMLPAYPEAMERAAPLKTIARFYLPGVPGQVRLLEGHLPDSQVIVWLVDFGPAFDRRGNPYLDPDGKNWPDNAERFALLSRCATEVAMGRAGLRWVPEVVHCNDWQSGLVPALLSTETARPATLFTIHNLAYQGLFPQASFHALGLPPHLWAAEGLEFHGDLSFIKGGLFFADHITTVSPNYAREIQTPEFGCGLEGLLQHRSRELSGILNGIDVAQWNPADDPHLQHSFDARDLSNKAENKRALQKTFGLPRDHKKLLLASVGRLAEQKGIDWLLAAIQRLASLPVQLVLLGTGDAKLEQALRKAQQRFPDRLSVRIGYDEGLAHRIEAGADAFLMPSRFEPCGLNQLYSQRYGTLPIVHAVGGLKDTVVDYSPATLADGSASGFCFYQPRAEALLEAVERAATLFTQHITEQTAGTPGKTGGQRKKAVSTWQKMMLTSMGKDVSWRRSARQYAKLYQELLKR